MSRVAWFATIVLLTLAGVAIAWRFREEIVLFLLSLVVAAAVRPVVNGLAARGLRPLLAMLLVYVGGILLFVAALAWFGDSLASELETATNQAAGTYETITEEWPKGSSFQQAVAARLPPADKLFGAASGQAGQAVLLALLGVAGGVLDLVAKLAIVLVLSVYWQADYVRLERLWLSLLPAEKRARARSLWRAVEASTGSYVRSEIVQSVLATIVLGAGYWALGVPYPILLALLGGVGWLVPLLGPVLVLTPLLLVVWSGGLVFTLVATAFTLVVLLALEFLVEPRFFERQRYSSLLIVMAIIILFDGLGLLGLLIAPPLAVAFQVFMEQMAPSPTPVVARPSFAGAQFEERLQHVRETIAGMDEPLRPEVANLLDRLTRLVDKAERELK